MPLTPAQIQAIVDRDLPGYEVVVDDPLGPEPTPVADVGNLTVDELNVRFSGRRTTVTPDFDAEDVVVEVRPEGDDGPAKIVIISVRDGRVVSAQG